MRDILFRGFHENPSGKEKAFYAGTWHVGSWVEGSLNIRQKTTHCVKEDYDSDPDNTEYFILFDQMTDWGLPNEHIEKKVAPETVGQYIGRNDIQGQMIFENDYICCQNYHGDVHGFVGVSDTTVFLICMSGYSDEYLFNCSDIRIVGKVFDKKDIEDFCSSKRAANCFCNPDIKKNN